MTITSILSTISDKERTPLVDALLIIIQQQAKELENLKKEIARLKKHPEKPTIKPSKLEKKKDKKGNDSSLGGGKRPGSSKKRKKLKIHETKIIEVKELPAGSKFKGYRDYDVQDIEILLKNTRYRLERWVLPNGNYVTARLPESIKGYHFGPMLRSYILDQHTNQYVTQPLLREQLIAFGVDISTGELNRILNDEKDIFHEEKEAILRTGLMVSKYIQADDTGARHQGKNGFCTHIGNKFFAYFASRRYKNRINFLELLRAGHQDYVFNQAAIDYVKKQKLSEEWLTILLKSDCFWTTKKTWEAYLEKIGLENKRYTRIVTEGALIGSIDFHGLMKHQVILSDDAGQFNIFEHALCWIHAERAITRLIPDGVGQTKSLKRTLDRFWTLYRLLKKYKEKPTMLLRRQINQDFDELCAKRTGCATLKNALRRLKRNKAELLLVLDRPEIPLHNNLSENDIRTYVKKRKISGGTRSELGRECRDTFASLKKTCKKLNISFWDYLKDRIFKLNEIPRLSVLVYQAALADG